MIDDDIIANFQSKFKNHKIKMSVPAICNGFDKCDIYRIDDAVQRHKDDFFDGIDDLISNEEKEVIEKLKDKINNKDIYQKVNKEVEKRVSVEFNKKVSQELDKKVNQEFDTKVIEEVSKQSEEIKKQLGEKVVDEETGFLDGIEAEGIPIDKKDNIIE